MVRIFRCKNIVAMCYKNVRVCGFYNIYMCVCIVNTRTSDGFSTFEYGGTCFLMTIMHVGVFSQVCMY